jgi:hypothetical protein
MGLFSGLARMMRGVLPLSAAALWLSVSALAHADKVHLRSGSVLEGKVSREGDKVVVQLESGEIRLSAESVVRIESSVTPLEEITRLRAALPEDAVDQRLALADRCRAKELARCERELLEEIVARDPDHAEARLRLGYVRSERGWLTRAEQQEQKARALERERTARAENERAVSQAAILRETAELSRKQAELALERERLALERAQLEQSEAWRAPGYFLSYFGHYPLHPPKLSPPHVEPYIINGVRSPSEAGFDIPGVRSPQSYFR